MSAPLQSVETKKVKKGKSESSSTRGLKRKAVDKKSGDKKARGAKRAKTAPKKTEEAAITYMDIKESDIAKYWFGEVIEGPKGGIMSYIKKHKTAWEAPTVQLFQNGDTIPKAPFGASMPFDKGADKKKQIKEFREKKHVPLPHGYLRTNLDVSLAPRVHTRYLQPLDKAAIAWGLANRGSILPFQTTMGKKVVLHTDEQIIGTYQPLSVQKEEKEDGKAGAPEDEAPSAPGSIEYEPVRQKITLGVDPSKGKSGTIVKRYVATGEGKFKLEDATCRDLYPSVRIIPINEVSSVWFMNGKWGIVLNCNYVCIMPADSKPALGFTGIASGETESTSDSEEDEEEEEVVEVPVPVSEAPAPAAPMPPQFLDPTVKNIPQGTPEHAAPTDQNNAFAVPPTPTTKTIIL